MKKKVTVLVVLALFIVGVTVVFAAPPYDRYFRFYSDAAMTNQVGWYYQGCTQNTWGGTTWTQYYTVEPFEPCSNYNGNEPPIDWMEYHPWLCNSGSTYPTWHPCYPN